MLQEVMNDYEKAFFEDLKDLMAQGQKYVGDDTVIAGFRFGDWRDVGYKTDSGVTCRALILDNVVLKWYRDTERMDSDEQADLEFISSIPPEDSIHFARTEVVDGITIQEKIIDGRELCKKDRDRAYRLSNSVETVAQRYGLLGDMHFGNWGVRPSDPETPVIFDVGYRR